MIFKTQIRNLPNAKSPQWIHKWRESVVYCIFHDILGGNDLILQVWAEEKENTFGKVDFKVDNLPQEPQRDSEWEEH